MEPIRFVVPSSKSETQRALVLASLSPGESTIERPLACEDSQAMRHGLRALGASVRELPDRWLVRGGPLHAPERPIDCRDGGTTARFLGPLCLLCEGALVLDGSPRLRERPIGEMVEALMRLGVEARYLAAPGRLPLSLRRPTPLTVRRTAVGGARSSQFASGLLLAAPLLPLGLVLELEGEVVSRPYLALTVHMMRQFGAEIGAAGAGWRVEPKPYRPATWRIGGDWSSAALLLVGGLLTGRSIELQGMDPSSAQADRAIVHLLGELGQGGRHSFDLSDCPDLLPPMAVAAAFADRPVELRGIRHARLKESDRPAVLARELGRAGICIVEREDGLRIEPGGRLRPARLDPCGDHRMAMAFGLLSLREPGIECLEPACVAKSYPGFWAELERLR
jgi:3-phosphoshikimate 1-carboxyvinyltransferase